MLGGSILVFGLLVTWLTPLWLVSVGVALGVVVLAVAYGILFLMSRRAADFVLTSVREGILLPVAYLALFLTGFAVLATFLVPELPYRTLLTSVSRIGAVGPAEVEITVPAATHNFEPENLHLLYGELVSFSADADQRLVVNTNIPTTITQTLSFKVGPGNPSSWTRTPTEDRDRQRDKTPPDAPVMWSITNVNNVPATLKLHVLTDISYPEVRVVPGAALSLIGLVAVYLLMQVAMPKVSAIALATAKESMAQPLFYVVMAFGCFMLVAFIFIPYNTFGEDVKVLKDSGLTLIMILSIVVAVWSASVSVWEEVEGRTALTVLSKPVQRRQFILGKFLGILGPVVVLFIVLGFLFLVTVSYKVVYDAREVAKSEPAWQLCYLEMIRIVPGLVLSLLEAIVLASISVAISTRLPMLANLLICGSIYVLGHLVPMLVDSSVGKFETVRFVGHLLATVLPVLDHFNIQAAVAQGQTVPLSYLGAAFLYCLVYSTIAMLAALLMFEDRDLA